MHPILGIDVGKHGLHVAHPTDNPNPRNWRVVELPYTDPDWHLQLLALVGDVCTITAESTGYHLLAPVAALIRARRPAARLWQVEGKLTGSYRSTWLSGAKNDRLDALALLLVARDIALGAAPRHCRPYDHARESDVQRLRLAVNTHMRLTKENTRLLNRLDALAHSIWPTLALKKTTYLRAVAASAVTPAQLRALEADPPAGWHPSARAALRRLLKLIPPDISADPAIEASIRDLAEQQQQAAGRLEANLTTLRAIIYNPPFDNISNRWATIPGASDIFIAALHVPTRGQADQMDADSFRAACGINPLISISGAGDKTKLTKRGYRPARWALYMWTLTLIRDTTEANPVRDYRAAVTSKHDFWAARSKLARLLVGVAKRPEGYTYFGSNRS